MSYIDFMKEVEKASSNSLNENASNIVRDNWISKRKYKELIFYVLENWDSGNCDEFIKPLTEKLLDEADLYHFKLLFRGIIRHRLNNLWENYKDLNSWHKGLDVKLIKNIDVSDFNIHSWEDNRDLKKVVAFHRQFCLNALIEYKDGLREMNAIEEATTVEKMISNVDNLIKPKPKPTIDNRKIDENLFWELIEEARKKSENSTEFLGILEEKLMEFKSSEIKKFSKFTKKFSNDLHSSDLWALAYIVRNGCSDDCFDYFKAWVISKGRYALKTVSESDGENLMKLFNEDPQLEEFLDIAEKVYVEKTGTMMPYVSIKAPKLKGTMWKVDELPHKFPHYCDVFDFKE